MKNEAANETSYKQAAGCGGETEACHSTQERYTQWLFIVDSLF